MHTQAQRGTCRGTCAQRHNRAHVHMQAHMCILSHEVLFLLGHFCLPALRLSLLQWQSKTLNVSNRITGKRPARAGTGYHPAHPRFCVSPTLRAHMCQGHLLGSVTPAVVPAMGQLGCVAGHKNQATQAPPLRTDGNREDSGWCRAEGAQRAVPLGVLTRHGQGGSGCLRVGRPRWSHWRAQSLGGLGLDQGCLSPPPTCPVPAPHPCLLPLLSWPLLPCKCPCAPRCLCVLGPRRPSKYSSSCPGGPFRPEGHSLTRVLA